MNFIPKDQKTITQSLFSILLTALILLSLSACNTENKKQQRSDDMFSYAQSRKDDLRLSVYITAHAVKQYLSGEAGRREALSIIKCNGITKAYIEVYRGGLVLDKGLLTEVRDFFEENDIEVTGGIATVPGKDFGVHQEGPLGWFNWQNKKTQNNLKKVIKETAGIFDEFIIDDFLCTSDTSMESKTAKGNRSWSQYRRDLLTGLSASVFIEPAREVNPDIKIIIKYPQWYDRFHLFGYDLSREPRLFDKVWVGTETRGQFTQRYGYVQPYEGFINYRWIKDITSDKIGGGWFDHGDCDANDFIEQAWQTVAAGVKEIVLFNYFDFLNGHKGHHLLRTQFKQLADLAHEVSQHSVTGISAYKPINSDAEDDLYLMDFIGMLGIPEIPVHKYPSNAKVILLPTQAAADKDILKKVERSIKSGATLIFTSGFLANAKDGKRIASLAGIRYPVNSSPVKASYILTNGKKEAVRYGLDLESRIIPAGSSSVITALNGNEKIPFFTKNMVNNSTVYTLNTHTFSQTDFDAVGEVLLCPKPLGLLEISERSVDLLRNDIISGLHLKMNAPTRVVLQPLGSTGWLIQNYNKKDVKVTLTFDDNTGTKLINAFSGNKIITKDNTFSLTMKPRSRIWIKKVK